MKTPPPQLEHAINCKTLGDAWNSVRRNHGAPGVDGENIAELSATIPMLLPKLADRIQAGQYRPQPLRRVVIPKPGGGERLLGIPTVLDRVVQKAVAEHLSPHWEPIFSTASFAYRPQRTPLQAVQFIKSHLYSPSAALLHLDIRDFFDSVPHHLVLRNLAELVKDHRILDLIAQCLRCGVFENGIVRESPIGIAQGSPLSPLLANIALHPLDLALEATGLPFARYADDVAIVLRDDRQADDLLPFIRTTLARLDLVLNEAKTTMESPERSVFLGFSFENRDHRWLTAASSQSCRELVHSLDESPSRVVSVPHSFHQLATMAAERFSGWLSYYGHAEERSGLLAVLEECRDYVRLAPFKNTSDPASTYDLLTRHGISPENAGLALSAALAGDRGLLLHWLRIIYPARAFAAYGLGENALASSSFSFSRSSTDYSGRFENGRFAGKPTARFADSFRCWGWWILRNRLVNLDLQLQAGSLRKLPLFRSLGFKIGSHCIRFR